MIAAANEAGSFVGPTIFPGGHFLGRFVVCQRDANLPNVVLAGCVATTLAPLARGNQRQQADAITTSSSTRVNPERDACRFPPQPAV
jgi:hypothetical protein